MRGGFVWLYVILGGMIFLLPTVSGLQQTLTGDITSTKMAEVTSSSKTSAVPVESDLGYIKFGVAYSAELVEFCQNHGILLKKIV